MRVKKRILLVDDDRDFVELIQGALESEGYEVSTAYDGASGLGMARTAYPDLLLLDVMMTSNTEGFDVCRDLRRIRELEYLPVIVLTGIHQAMGLGFHIEPEETWLPAQAVLEKPVSLERLLREIKKCLSGKRGVPAS